jgi:hypothetical protein
MLTLTRNVKQITGFISHIYVIRDKYVIITVRLEQNTAIHYKETKEEEE